MILPVVSYPSSILNQVSELVTEEEISSGYIKTLAANLLETVVANGGIGISAIQVGIPKRLMIVSSGNNDFITMINPEIWLRSSEMELSKESCLSYLKNVEVFRPSFVNVHYTNLEGEIKELTTDGVLKNCICHELDHLEGKGIWQKEILNGKNKDWFS